MDTINGIAWAMVLIVGGWWAFLRFQCWRADRRLKQLRDEAFEIGRSIGMPDSMFKCPHGVVIGDDCRICDKD